MTKAELKEEYERLQSELGERAKTDEAAWHEAHDRFVVAFEAYRADKTEENERAYGDAKAARVTALEQNSALDTDLTDLKSAVAALQSQMAALQAEATAKWVLLNTVDNRSRANDTSIAALDGRVAALEQG